MGTVPTSGWSVQNAIVYNDYLVPDRLGIHVKDNVALNYRLLTQSLGGNSQYTFIATMRCLPVPGAGTAIIGFYVTDGTKLEGIDAVYNGSVTHAVRVQKMTDVNTDAATLAGPTGSLSSRLMTVKIVKDASNRTFYYYAAGAFTQFYQEAASAHLTETDIGIGGATNINNTIYHGFGELLQWSLTLGPPATGARSFAAVIL